MRFISNIFNASRWKEAMDDGVAPKVDLAATHASTLEYASLDELKQHAVDVAIAIVLLPCW